MRRGSVLAHRRVMVEFVVDGMVGWGSGKLEVGCLEMLSSGQDTR